MSPEAAKPAIVVVGHLGAKGGRIRAAADRAAALFAANGYAVTVLSTESAEHHPRDPAGWCHSLRRHLRTHHGTGLKAVVAVGGDGTAHLVVNALLDWRLALGPAATPEVAFGLIASGSGNDLARHWGVPVDDPERAAGRVLRRLDTAAASGPVRMDVGEVQFQDGNRAWFTTAMCAGIDAAVNARANGYRWPRGSFKYVMALAVEIFKHPPQLYRLVSESSELTPRAHLPDGAEATREIAALMVNVANTSSIGGGLGIVPDADPADGTMELFVVAPLTRLQFLRLFPSIYTGAHVRLAAVEISPVTRVRICGEHVVYADGEPLGRLPVTVSVRPAALPVAL